jgi:hypothetical protein
MLLRSGFQDLSSWLYNPWLDVKDYEIFRFLNIFVASYLDIHKHLI